MEIRSNMFKRDLPGKYAVVPAESVAMNGVYIGRLNTAEKSYAGPVCVLLPQTGRAAMDDTGERPYVYANPTEAEADAAVHRTLMIVDKL